MSAADTIAGEEPIRPKRFWTQGVLDLRSVQMYPRKQVPGIALIFGMGAFCLWGLWRVAKSNQRKGYVREKLEKCRRTGRSLSLLCGTISRRLLAI